jgi:AraC-like DNA-binding protein
MAPRNDLEALARSRLPQVLAALFDLDSKEARVAPATHEAYDLSAKVGGKSFIFDVLGGSSPALLTHWQRVSSAARRQEIPVMVVPSMSRSGRDLSQAHGINWVDLAGNASIRAPGLQIRIEGQPNRYARPGRPASVFERRSSRLTRLLLQHPGREWTLRECAKESGLNEGHVSRIVSRLVAEEFLRKEGKRLRVAEPLDLLDAWRDAADFSKHRVLRGHVAARSGAELLALASRRLADAHLEHAATGLGAAWLYDRFAMFRLVTLYLREWPSPAQLEQLHFREEPNGANVWLVLPADDGVFDGARVVEGVPCVHPVQVYVDLKDQPERATEAADHLKQNPVLLGGGNGAS